MAISTISSPAALTIPGSVLQVVQTVKTDTFATTSGSYTDVTGLSVTITPKFSTSKILVLADIHYGSNTDSGYAFFQLVRTSTAIYVGDSSGSRTVGSAGGCAPGTNPMAQANMVYLDSPATTSATTYKIQTLSQNTSYSVTVNKGWADSDASYALRTASSITVLEIAG